jgi:hypothetical protein
MAQCPLLHVHTINCHATKLHIKRYNASHVPPSSNTHIKCLPIITDIHGYSERLPLHPHQTRNAAKSPYIQTTLQQSRPHLTNKQSHYVYINTQKLKTQASTTLLGKQHTVHNSERTRNPPKKTYCRQIIPRTPDPHYLALSSVPSRPPPQTRNPNRTSQAKKKSRTFSRPFRRSNMPFCVKSTRNHPRRYPVRSNLTLEG